MNTILYFTADWCNPCKKVRPIAEELVRDGANIKFIDVDVEIEMVKNFKIMSVPTFVVMRDNSEIYRSTGVKTLQELNELIKYETLSPGVSINPEEKKENFIMYFTADWCEPCRNTRPIVEAFNQENETRKIFIIDTDETPQMKEDFKLLSIPTFIFIKNGEEVRRESGKINKEKLEGYIRYLEH